MRRVIHGVLVAWRKAPEAVAANVRDLKGQLDALVVVDNAESRDPACWDVLEQQGWKLVRIANGANVGLARAMNQGIEAVLKGGAEFVLLLDEDSRPAADMVEGLLRVWEKRTAMGEAVAAVGPNFLDRRSSRRAVFVQVQGARLQRMRCGAPEEEIRSDYLISSGALVHRKALEDVGLMREDFFVDLVDTEWCWRAGARGYRCYGACGADMQHDFGEGTLSMPIWGRSVPYREPVRNYYAFRNSLQLIRLDYVPWRWKLYATTRLLSLFVLHVIAASQRLRHAHMMIAGVIHGLAGKTGPYHDGHGASR